MKFLSLTLLLLPAFHFMSFAQQPPFVESNVTLPQLAYSACAWGDFDHDGNLDLALTGVDGNSPVTKIFRNDGGAFNELPVSAPALHFGSAEWGDYDNDGDLDLLVTGMDSLANLHMLIVRNDTGNFTDSGISFPGMMDGQASWGDADNDGYLDILFTGSLASGIFRNNGDGTFTNVNAPFPPFETSMCCWNDYNNDGQSDVLVCGYSGDGIFSKLYRNDHGTFTDVTVTPEPFTGLYGGQARWADLDNDGDQDLVIAGADVYVDGYLLIYRNDGNDGFTKFDIESADLLNPSTDLGDFDGDGMTDIALMGTVHACGGAAVTRVFRNLGSMNFDDVSTLLPGYKLGGVSWGDFNNDGHSDLLLTGLDAYDVPKTGLYLNTSGDTSVFVVNTPPTVPQDLQVSMEAEKAILSWRPSGDEQTPVKSITYNILVGTSPGSSDILSPLADISTGDRLVAAPGNCSADTNWNIAGIPAGTYYFRVQAIDNGFMPGAFSTPCMFNFPPLGIHSHLPSNFRITPNPCHDRVSFEAGPPAGTGCRVRIISESGTCLFEGVNPGQVSVTAWPKGIYVVQYQNGADLFTGKLVKE